MEDPIKYDKYNPPYLQDGKKYPSSFPDKECPYAHYNLNLHSLLACGPKTVGKAIDLLIIELAILRDGEKGLEDLEGITGNSNRECWHLSTKSEVMGGLVRMLDQMMILASGTPSNEKEI